ncbi:MAG: hypothetical protein JWP91_1429 [Fibrobacteres bacterium]|nr:hypothetical protein [Fibrobacterota bacterium]
MRGNIRIPGKAPLSVVIAALALFGCTTEDGREYDVPARQEVMTAVFELDGDGTPIVLADVGMNFGTRAKLEEYEAPFEMRNVQTIAYRRVNGKWQAHPFKNLQRIYESGSSLVRNAKGDLQPMVWNRNALSMFSRNGGDWNLKSLVRIGEYGLNSSLRRGGGDGISNVSVVGDDRWQTVVGDWDKHRLEVVQSDGKRFLLDTLAEFQTDFLYSGPEYNMALGIVYPREVDGQPELLSYRWSLDPAHANPIKEILSRGGYAGVALSARINGEDRLYLSVEGDTLAEYAFRSGGLVRLGPVIPPEHDPGPPLLGNFRPSMAQDRCIHTFGMAFRDTALSMVHSLAMVHSSWCRAGSDTIPLPTLPLERTGYPLLAGPLQIAADGTLMAAVMIKHDLNKAQPWERVKEIPASGIYMVRSSDGGTHWEWETVAEF